jgi:hypothetical protein
MPQTEFERGNLARAYPLVAHALTDIYPLIADLSITVRPAAAFRHGQHRIELFAAGPLTTGQAGLLYVGTATRFVAFTSMAPGIRSETLLFAYSDEHPYSVIRGVTRPLSSLLTIVFGAPTQPIVSDGIDKWEGYLTIGDVATTPSTSQWLVPSLPIEPARITNTVEAVATPGVTYVYNQALTQYAAPNGCQDISDPPLFSSGEYVRSCEPIIGEFRIAGGHSTTISQNTPSRTVTISADGSSGELGGICEPLPLVDTDSDEDTAIRCDEVLRSINGISGPVINVTPLSSVEIGRYPEQHRLIIAPIGIDAANCPASVVAEAVEYIPSVEGIPCGNFGEPVPPPPGPPDDGAGYQTVSSTSTTTGSSVPNACRWEAIDFEWHLAYYPCLSPYGCETPEEPAGPDGDTAYTACEQVPDVYGTYVLNPVFLSAAPFSAWDTVGPVEIWPYDDWEANAQDIPQAALPVAKVTAATLGASLIQRLINIDSNSTYVLQFECAVVQGTAELAIGTETNFYTATRVTLTPSTHGTWGEVVVGPLTYTTGPLRIVITAGPAAILYIGQFALVKQ